MVFEGVLVSVLNRFLGPYLKNLDSSQLSVGIWSGKRIITSILKCTFTGEVSLQKLEVKETALVSVCGTDGGA